VLGDHNISVFLNVLVTWEHLRTAAESEPTVTLSIMLATATTRKFLACDDAEDLLGLQGD
jgi:hypothetical protein